MDGALNGIRVIDFSTVVTGPYATRSLGADVIKVESPAGDSSRVPPPCQHVGMSSLTLALHRDKRAIAVDPRDERGKKIFRDLVATAEVRATGTPDHVPTVLAAKAGSLTMACSVPDREFARQRREPHHQLGYSAQQITELSSDGVTVAAVYGESTGAQG